MSAEGPVKPKAIVSPASTPLDRLLNKIGEGMLGNLRRVPAPGTSKPNEPLYLSHAGLKSETMVAIENLLPTERSIADKWASTNERKKQLLELEKKGVLLERLRKQA